MNEIPLVTPRVLLVDDEPPIVELLRGYLEREGMEVHWRADGIGGLAAARDLAPDVVVLDVMLPGIDGFEVCRQLRTFSDAYVLMLTARTDEIDRVVGLSVGADDYVIKPFSPRELVARVKALLRRPRTSSRESAPAFAAAGTPPPGTTRDDEGSAATGWTRGDLTVDLRRRSVTVKGLPVELTALEFELLALLSREPGVVFTRQQLLDRVWGVDFVGDDHVVDVHVANLRRRLGDDAAHPAHIETVRGVGYRYRTTTSASAGTRSLTES